MKKLTLILMLLAAGLMAISCGHDEPVDPNEITRVQDGKGKVFLENGTLVDANLDYTQAELIDALNKYDWERFPQRWKLMPCLESFIPTGLLNLISR